MPSHVHAIIAFSNTDKSVNTVVSNGKRFIAYDLIKGFPSPQSLFKMSCPKIGLHIL